MVLDFALYILLVLYSALYKYRILHCTSSKKMIWNMIPIKFTIDVISWLCLESNSHGIENALGQYMNGYSLSILIYYDFTGLAPTISLKKSSDSFSTLNTFIKARIPNVF